MYEGGEFEFVFWDGGADVWVSFSFLFCLLLGLGDVLLRWGIICWVDVKKGFE